MVKASNAAVTAETSESKRAAEKVQEKVAEKRRALGRGLDSLLPSLQPAKTASPGGPGLPPQRAKTGLAGDPGLAPRVVTVPPAAPSPAVSVAPIRMTEGRIAELRAEGEDRGPLELKPGSPGTPGVSGAPADSLHPQHDEGLGVPRLRDGIGSADPAAPFGMTREITDELSVERQGELEHYPAVGRHTRNHGQVPREEVEEDARRAAMGEVAPVQVGYEALRLEIDLIDDNPHQTRLRFNGQALEEMAQSIRVQGVLQPIVVRPAGDGRYKLILGERRMRAARIAGLETIPAIVKRVNEQQAAEMTLVENVQRQDLDCLEQADAFSRLSQNFHLTQEEIGKRVGMSREAVANYMRLLTLPEGVLEHVAGGRLSFSHARALMPLKEPAQIWSLAQRAIEENLTVAELEDIVKGVPVPHTYPHGPKRKTGARWLDPNVKAAQRSLEEVLGMRVRISDRQGRGKIVISYETIDDFDRVVEMLRGK